jgi:hypothetical protein
MHVWNRQDISRSCRQAWPFEARVPARDARAVAVFRMRFVGLSLAIS